MIAWNDFHVLDEQRLKEDTADNRLEPANTPMSNARLSFFGNSGDILRYFGFHQLAWKTPALRKNIDIVDKAMFVFVASLWEAYCEALATEAAELLVEKAASWESIPSPLVKVISKELRSLDSDTALWSLAGDGWRKYLRDRLDLIGHRRAFTFASPRSDAVDRLFRESAGIAKISDAWHADPAAARAHRDQLDGYVMQRNRIVHEYRLGRTVHKRDVKAFYGLVNRLTSKTDGAVDKILVKATGISHWTTPMVRLKHEKELRRVSHIARCGSSEFSPTHPGPLQLSHPS